MATKRRGEESLDVLSSRLDSEIARRKELALKVAEKEVLVVRMAAQVEAEDIALTEEMAVKKAELEQLREAIARASQLLERRSQDAVRIAAQASGIDKAMMSLRAQMASRFVLARRGGPALTDDEMTELTRQGDGKSTPSRPSLLVIGDVAAEQDPMHAAVLTEARRWSLNSLGLPFDAFTETSRLAGAMVAQLNTKVQARPPSPSAIPTAPPPAPVLAPSPRHSDVKQLAALAKPPPRTNVTSFVYGCSETDAEAKVRQLLQQHVQQVGRAALDAHAVAAQRIRFEDLAATDPRWPS
jgi:hypothetical protein